MSVPKNIQGKYDEIAALITPFCDEYLNDEYKTLCLHAPEKLGKGLRDTAAAGVVSVRAGKTLSETSFAVAVRTRPDMGGRDSLRHVPALKDAEENNGE